MAYSIDAITDDCYSGTTCLINKLGIQDENMLAETEAAIILGKVSLLEQSPIPGDFDFDHYKRIHHFLFCAANKIADCASACFSRMAAFQTDGLTHRALAEEVADLYHTVNMLHPFREGNGRTQRVFFTQWLRHLGYDFDLADIDPDVFMIATIFAAQGVMDQLEDFFDQTIYPLQMSREITMQ